MPRPVHTVRDQTVRDQPVAPKIELHVHLEGAVRPAELAELASRNGLRLPASSPGELAELYRFSDFRDFMRVWLMTTGAIRTEADFRQIVVSYAKEAASHGAVYVEAIFTPAERVAGGECSWDEVFSGFCDGAAEAGEQLGVTVRLTVDVPRTANLAVAMTTAHFAVKYHPRGVVGLGLGGPERGFPPERFAPAFRRAREGGVGSVPHAGEGDGPASVRGALESLGADRLRNGIRAVEDPGLVGELAARGVVCDVCPTSNLRTGAVASLEDHPLARLLDAGVLCSIGTDDPAMFGTDLGAEHRLAAALGATAEGAYRAGVRGALCDEATRARLEQIGREFSWQRVG
ncbi:MAG TPA: adenosine deaminase [Acidimicrobiales bacterium]|nr:adenosine deaminase [Acidimicrobiales bacterium]